jgi:hypothetical protein
MASMMNDPEFDRLREIIWRHKPTPDQQAKLEAWLAAHPETQSDWDQELGLSEALRGLPNAPLANNFTSRVIQAVERDQTEQARRQRRRALAWWTRLLPKAALAALIAGAGAFSWHQFHISRLQAEVRHSVLAISDVPSLPNGEALQDFDAILLSSESAADEQLLKLLQ